MAPGEHDFFSCSCSIFTYEATCTFYRCNKHKDFKPRLLERGCKPCQRVKDIAIELIPDSSSAFTNAPHAQAGTTQFIPPQSKVDFQHAGFQGSPNGGPSFASLMNEFCNQVREDEDGDHGFDRNEVAMSGGNGESMQDNSFQGYVMNGEGMPANNGGYDFNGQDMQSGSSEYGVDNGQGMPANDNGHDFTNGQDMQSNTSEYDVGNNQSMPTNNSESSSQNIPENTPTTQKSLHINDLYSTILNASSPFLRDVIASARTASTTELQLSKQATSDALYNSIKNGLDEAISLRDIDVNCERANVKHWIQDIKEGRSTLEDMEMGLWLSGEAKDLGRAMNAEKMKDRILKECMETLNANL
ncbi:hypothetical protein BKA64DRAFT_699008 [Cadophora sp. MPI-SDFR-AT-0126]|nr:hypothetical protein BKA64DRAFT_699008 [Leotiomycetes sp. MPI-SDFR-AT-0126]